MKENLAFIYKVNKLIPIVLMFLMPLFFLPVTTEFFELNKLALLIGATIMMALLWVIRTVSGEKISILRSPVDTALLAFTIVVVLSTVFSLNKTISIYGSQSRWFPGMMGILIMVVYYYLSTTYLTDKATIKTGLYALLLSSTIATVISILSYYNVFLSKEAFMRIPNFSTTGSITSATYVATIAFILASTFIAYETGIIKKLLLLIASIVNFYYVALLGGFIGWGLIAVALVASLIFINVKKAANSKVAYFVILVVALALTGVNALPVTRKLIANVNFPSELNLSLRDSWVVAASTIQDYPILATGPSTFGLNFPRYKSIGMNLTPYWDVRFDKPYNEVINILGTMGLLGIAAALYLGFSVIKTAQSAKGLNDETGLTNVLAVLVITMTAQYLFTYATVLNTFLFLSIISFFVGSLYASDTKERLVEEVLIGVTSVNNSVSSLFDGSVVRKEYVKYILMVPVVLGIAFVGYSNYRHYMGEVFMKMSLNAAQNNNVTSAYDFQRRAIVSSPGRDYYYIAYAQTNMALANIIASKQNLTDTDKQNVQRFIDQAVRTMNTATESVNPLNPSVWEVRGLLARNIMTMAKNSDEWTSITLNAYATAMQLDPLNPRIKLSMGEVYFAKEEFLGAANEFKQATNLKPNYANAHYNFAQALLKLNDPKGAKRELEITRSLITPDTEDYKKVETEIAAIKDTDTQPTVAGANDAQNKPTVSTGDTMTKPETNQDPLTKPGKVQTEE